MSVALTESEREALSSAIARCDAPAVTALMADFEDRGATSSALTTASEMLVGMPHDVQHWWGAPCDLCPGL